MPLTEAPKEDQAATSANTEKRSQPWKAHWPPKKDICKGIAYGVPKGQVVVIFGN
jgi:hypothetical protein